MSLQRRKNLERNLPQFMRRGGDKVRVFEDETGRLFIIVGAAFRTESELSRMAEQSHAAAELAAAPVGGSC